MRLCIGIENVNDVIEDIKRGLDAV
ncbi:PLP-dependent transferase [Pseudomonas syringae]|nr:PLP-dependent transferase [Pseudomonas syringae]MCR8722556.1 PLP-dependent transferase [Pseudomonas syringae]